MAYDLKKLMLLLYHVLGRRKCRWAMMTILEEPIKELGVYQIPIRLHPDVEAKIKVWVVKE